MKKEIIDKIRSNKKLIIILFLAVFALFIILNFNIVYKTCDDECFDEKLRECKFIDFITHKNNNVYRYTIFSSLGNYCKIRVTLERTAPGSDPDIKELLEGKSMECRIPKQLLKTTNLDNIDNFLQYCTGELKEGILELIIKRMYSLIIGNLEEIVQESKSFLNEI